MSLGIIESTGSRSCKGRYSWLCRLPGPNPCALGGTTERIDTPVSTGVGDETLAGWPPVGG